MKKLHLIALASLISLCPSAGAHIGETPAQCEARYGPSIGSKPGITDGSTVYVYEKSGFDIGVQFSGGVAEAVLFSKVEKDALGNPVEISDNEIQILLKSNSSGKEWFESGSLLPTKAWFTDGKKLFATYDPFSHVLMIITASATQKASEEQNAGEAKNLKGL